jgi:hypothetical protein
VNTEARRNLSRGHRQRYVQRENADAKRMRPSNSRHSHYYHVVKHAYVKTERSRPSRHLYCRVRNGSAESRLRGSL